MKTVCITFTLDNGQEVKIEADRFNGPAVELLETRVIRHVEVEILEMLKRRYTVLDRKV